MGSASAEVRRRESFSADLTKAFAVETRRGAQLAVIVVAFWALLFATRPFANAIYTGIKLYALFHVKFAWSVEINFTILASLPIYFIALRSKRPLVWCFLAMLADIVVWSQGIFNWLWKGPGAFASIPLFLAVRYGDITSFLVLLSIYALPLSRTFILWGTVTVVAVWAIGVADSFLAYHHGVLYWGPLAPGAATVHDILGTETLVVDFFVIQLVLAACFAGFLALSVRQGRRFVVDRVSAAADSAFLERFFPPQLAAEIAKTGGGSLLPARRHVVILFAQIQREGVSDLNLLQSDFEEIERVAFAHDAILDRFTGDAAMAVFGALGPDPGSPAKAFACAKDLGQTFRGRMIFLSLHTGEAVCGDVGGTQSRVFGVVGDCVNVGHRILDTAEERALPVLVSDAFLKELGGNDGFAPLGEVALRGREAPVCLWSHGR